MLLLWQRLLFAFAVLLKLLRRMTTMSRRLRNIPGRLSIIRTKAQGYYREAEYYLKKAKSYEREATYYTKKGDSCNANTQSRYSRGARDNYQTLMRYAKNAEETAADYLKRARDVLRR